MKTPVSDYPLDVRDALRLPSVEDGLRIGIFGGSFNPPHEGHVHVSELALRRAGLDRIWWLVTPGNPLKDHSQLAPLEERIRLCRQIISDPRMAVTAFEVGLKTRFTADTLSILLKRRPRAKFVWVMGADNLGNFHKWQDWKKIASLMPIVVVDRPGSTLSFLSAPAAQTLSRFRLDESDARLIAGSKPPAWTFIHGARSSLSSTGIREQIKGYVKN